MVCCQTVRLPYHVDAKDFDNTFANSRSPIVMLILRRCLLSLTIIVASLSATAEDVAAQGANTPPATPTNVVKQSRPYYVEGAVVVLLMAAAGYAVCRSSRRV